MTQFYIRPDLVVAGSSSKLKDKLPFTTYRVSNDGNGAATKIEIGFMQEPAKTGMPAGSVFKSLWFPAF